MATKKKGGGNSSKKTAPAPAPADDGLAEGVVIGEATGGAGQPTEGASAEVVGTATAGATTQPPANGFAALLDTVGGGLTEIVSAARANRASRDTILADAEATETVLRETLGVTDTFVAAYKAAAGLTPSSLETPPVKRGPGRPKGSVGRKGVATRRQPRRTADGQPTNRDVIRTLARRRQSRRFTTEEINTLFEKEGRSSPGTVLYEMKKQGELKSLARGEYEYIGQ
jgi:hypothetical protein